MLKLNPNIEEHSRLIIEHLRSRGISHEVIDAEVGIIKIAGLYCKVAAPRQNSYKINVNLSWFDGNGNLNKPQYVNYNLDVDLYLFFKDNLVFYLHYIDLNTYALLLENDLTRWHNDRNWGLCIKEKSNKYHCHWVGNSIPFQIYILTSEDEIKNQKPNLIFNNSINSIKNIVEKIAIEETIKYYRSKGFSVISVENDNVGWDLEARNQNKFLRIEVKGRSGSHTFIELTPNEYKMSKAYWSNYRICIVTNTITNHPFLNEYYFDQTLDSWKNCKNNDILEVKEITSAKLYLKV